MYKGGVVPPIEEVIRITQRETEDYPSTSHYNQPYYHFDDDMTTKDVWELYCTLRVGGVSLRVVEDVIQKYCGKDGNAKRSNTHDIFRELDRRYFIVESARWEFTMLDLYDQGEIKESDAKSLFKTVQGSRYVGAWKLFMSKRVNPGSKVKWEDVEVPICEILQEQGEWGNPLLTIVG